MSSIDPIFWLIAAIGFVMIEAMIIQIKHVFLPIVNLQLIESKRFKFLPPISNKNIYAPKKKAPLLEPKINA